MIAMDQERWRRVKEIFATAAELDDAERGAYLDESTDGDAEMRAEVESLLAADVEESDILDAGVRDVMGEFLRRDLAERTERIGSYRLLSEIGRGGMAVVYEGVRDDEQYSRKVAVKLIKRGMETELVVARFRQERQILASLEHPNIARLYDGGVTDGGSPYLVMELVEGEPIDKWCADRSLSIRERLRLFLRVCAAVRYAHQNLVVHRDLKPSNILVTEDGVVKLLDFGIAKLLEPEGTAALAATALGQRPMTPEYASPEQVRGEAVTTASDVYSLGVLLYRLLTGHRPYRIRSTTPREIERAICEESPTRPSTVVGRPDRDESGSGGWSKDEIHRIRGIRKSLRRTLRGDLDNIVLKSLEKSPDLRYGSVVEFAEDIRHYLEGLPVSARRATPFYLTGKFIRRHRLGVLAAVLVFLSLVGGIVATLWQMREAHSQRLGAEWVSDFLVELFEVTHPGRALGETVTAHELLADGAKRINHGLEDGQEEVQATVMDAMGLAYFKLGLYKEAAPLLEGALGIRRLRSSKADLAASLDHVGELYYRHLADYDTAETLLHESMELHRQIYGPHHELVVEAENKLALVLAGNGKAQDAEELLLAELDAHREALGEHPEIAARLNNLALALKARGRLDEAEDLLNEARELHLKSHGVEHPWVIQNRRNQAEVVRELGDAERALGLYKDILATEHKILGDDHPNLATTLNNMAGCHLDMGEYDQAEALFRESLDLRRESFENEHPDVAQSLNNLGGIALERREYAEAKKLYERALAIYHRISPNHAKLPAVLNNLGTVSFRQEDFDAAERYYREAENLNRQLYGDEHDGLANNLNNLAFVLSRKGDYAAAEEAYRKALALNSRLLGDDHKKVLLNRQNLGENLIDQGKPVEAEQLLRDVLERLDRLGREGTVQRAVLRVGIARSLLPQNRADEAEPLLAEARAAWQDMGDRGRRGLAITESVLGATLAAQGHYDEADALLSASYAALLEAYGPEHPRTQDAHRWLGDLREALRRDPSQPGKISRPPLG